MWSHHIYANTSAEPSREREEEIVQAVINRDASEKHEKTEAAKCETSDVWRMLRVHYQMESLWDNLLRRPSFAQCSSINKSIRRWKKALFAFDFPKASTPLSAVSIPTRLWWCKLQLNTCASRQALLYDGKMCEKWFWILRTRLFLRGRSRVVPQRERDQWGRVNWAINPQRRDLRLFN